MPIITRNDEQIKVGVTPGLTAGLSYFVFDGTFGKPNYIGYEIVISEYEGRSPMIEGLDYSWDFTIGLFNLLLPGDNFQIDQWYKVRFQTAYQPVIPVVPNSLIDVTYFIRDINIPNILLNTNGTNAPLLERVNSFIQKYEPQCLNKILGYNLYQVLLNESSQRVTDLIYGVQYEDRYGHNRRWEGLVQPEVKISLIANYIYYYFQYASATQTTGKNTVVPKGTESVSVSPKDKMIAAWNFFSNEVADMYFFLWNNVDYPEFTEWQYCYGRRVTRKNNFLGL